MQQKVHISKNYVVYFCKIKALLLSGGGEGPLDAVPAGY